MPPRPVPVRQDCLFELGSQLRPQVPAHLKIEILSTGSRRTDGVVEHGEYADAGIGRYWMVDLLGGPSLTACHLAREFGYADPGPVTGSFASEVPFPVRVDLTALG